jgi:hypothetical protein
MGGAGGSNPPVQVEGARGGAAGRPMAETIVMHRWRRTIWGSAARKEENATRAARRGPAAASSSQAESAEAGGGAVPRQTAETTARRALRQAEDAAARKEENAARAARRGSAAASPSQAEGSGHGSRGMREDQVAAAVRFIGNPKVAEAPKAEKGAFLARRGLNAEEFAEAFKRHEQPAAGAGATPPAPVAAAPAAAASGPPEEHTAWAGQWLQLPP